MKILDICKAHPMSTLTGFFGHGDDIPTRIAVSHMGVVDALYVHSATKRKVLDTCEPDFLKEYELDNLNNDFANRSLGLVLEALLDSDTIIYNL